MKSLANTEKFPAGVGRSINRNMMVWNTADVGSYPDPYEMVFVTAWSGYYFHRFGCATGFENACEVETDETVKPDQVGVFTPTPGKLRFGTKKEQAPMMWKRADTKTRPMTLEERVEELERKLEKVG